MSNYGDEIWAWLEPPLRGLTLGVADEPGLSWDERRQSLLTELSLSDPRDHPAVAELVAWLDELSADERTRVIGGEDLAKHAYELAMRFGETGAEEYDEGAWGEYLAMTLPRWDGTAESWPTWRDWFSEHAAERSLDGPARQLAEYLDGVENEERVATFAQYGVTVAAPAEEALQEESLDQVMADLAVEVPGIEQLSQAELAEIVDEVLREQEDAT